MKTQKTAKELHSEALIQALSHAEWLHYWLPQLSLDERKVAIEMVFAKICQHCYEIVVDKSCHCTNDE